MSEKNNLTRRKFIGRSAVATTATLLAVSVPAFANRSPLLRPVANTPSKGYAFKDKSGKLTPFTFERRAVGDNDVLIEIKYSGICHSDIHTARGHWGKQTYPQVPGHEIAGIVTAVGKNVTKFKVGDKAGVGCMVDSCLTCESCKKGEEQYCDKQATVYTYGAPEKSSPTGISQGGYANNIIVRDHFVIKIPTNIELQHAAPLLCAGITTYSPLLRADLKKGDKVGIVGIGGLGHIAIKLAVSKGAEVYAFTTSPGKVADIKKFGAKEVIVVDSLDKLKPYAGKLDYMLSTVPYAYEVSAYTLCLKPYGTFTQVGVPIDGGLTINAFTFNSSRVKFSTSLIGGVPETQEVINYCAEHQLFPEIQIIKAEQINDAYDRVVNKEARYRYVIDAKTI